MAGFPWKTRWKKAGISNYPTNDAEVKTQVKYLLPSKLYCFLPNR